MRRGASHGLFPFRGNSSTLSLPRKRIKAWLRYCCQNPIGKQSHGIMASSSFVSPCHLIVIEHFLMELWLLTMPPFLSNRRLSVRLRMVCPRPPYGFGSLISPNPCSRGHHLSSSRLGSVASSSLTRLLDNSPKVILRELLSKWIFSIH